MSVDEECMMMNILLDGDEDLECSAKEEYLQKRKASDTSNDTQFETPKIRKKDRCSPKKKRRYKRNRKQSLDNCGEKEMILRPNYFVGIKVSNPKIHRMVKVVQETILSKEPALVTAMVPIPTLHITLAVAHLPDMEHVNRAAQIIDKCSFVHKDFFAKSASLHFKGLTTFGNEVLFAGIQQGETLEVMQKMAKDFEIAFQELTGTPTKKGFKPHLTILKLSKDFKLRKKGIFKIRSNLYSDMSDTEFGSQVVQGVQLLSMNKPKDENHYYYCSHQVLFDVLFPESEDHAECCKKPLSVKPKLENISQLQQRLQLEKDVVKRKFHSFSLAGLSSMFNRESENKDNRDSMLNTLFIIGIAVIVITATVRRMSSNT